MKHVGTWKSLHETWLHSVNIIPSQHGLFGCAITASMQRVADQFMYALDIHTCCCTDVCDLSGNLMGRALHLCIVRPLISSAVPYEGCGENPLDT